MAAAILHCFPWYEFEEIIESERERWEMEGLK